MTREERDAGRAKANNAEFWIHIVLTGAALGACIAMLPK